MFWSNKAMIQNKTRLKYSLELSLFKYARRNLQTFAAHYPVTNTSNPRSLPDSIIAPPQGFITIVSFIVLKLCASSDPD